MLTFLRPQSVKSRHKTCCFLLDFNKVLVSWGSDEFSLRLMDLKNVLEVVQQRLSLIFAYMVLAVSSDCSLFSEYDTEK